MRQAIPVTNPILVVDASAAAMGFKILNTGAVAVYVSQNKARLASSVNTSTGIPADGWPLNPNDKLEYQSAIGTWFAVAAGAGGELEVDSFPIDLPCCP